jgi:hypothetical protein
MARKLRFSSVAANLSANTGAGGGTDRAQRDRARQVYERIIGQSSVPRSDKIWSNVRNRWGAAREACPVSPSERHCASRPPRARQRQQRRWRPGGDAQG